MTKKINVDGIPTDSPADNSVDNSVDNNLALDAFDSFLGEESELPANWTIDYDKIYKALAFALRDLAFANRDRFPQFHPNGRFDQEAFNESFKTHFGYYNEYRFTEQQLLDVAQKRLRMSKADLMQLHSEKLAFFAKVGAGKNGKKYPQREHSLNSDEMQF